MIRSLREAMTRDDFPLLLQDSMFKVLLKAYNGFPSTFKLWTKEGSVPNFQPVRRIRLSESDDILGVGELEEYKMSSLGEAEVYYQVFKYGRRFGVSWETLINDDLQGIKDQPARFGRAAARKLAAFAIGLLESVTPDSDIDLALDSDPLQDAVTKFEERKDSKGNLIGASPKYLIVPPAQRFKAVELLESSAVVATGTTDKKVGNKNVTEDLLVPVVERLLTNPNDWYLAADPADIPGIEIGYLRGKTEPELARKKQDWEPLSSPYDIPETQYENDAVDYKVRYVYGGKVVDPNGLMKIEVASS